MKIYDDFLKKGKDIESNFAKHFLKTEIASNYEDMVYHVDIYIYPEVKYTFFGHFDVKGLKKVRRNDLNVSQKYHWVEFVNVNGKLGWLYGKVDYFAFETYTKWVIVSKNKLQEFISTIDKNEVINSKINNLKISEILHRKYTRPNRKDVIMLIKTNELIKISECIIDKEFGITDTNDFNKTDSERIAEAHAAYKNKQNDAIVY